MYFIRLAYVDMCTLKLDWFPVKIFMVASDVTRYLRSFSFLGFAG